MQNSFNSPQLGRSPYPDGPFQSPAHYGMNSFHLGSEQSLMNMQSPPSNTSSSSSLYPFESSDGYLRSSGQNLSNYGLGLVGPASPYMSIGGGQSLYDTKSKEDRSTKPVRSPLLEDFRADKGRRWIVNVSYRAFWSELFSLNTNHPI